MPVLQFIVGEIMIMGRAVFCSSARHTVLNANWTESSEYSNSPSVAEDDVLIALE